MNVKLITVPIAAREFGVHQNWVRFLCQTGGVTSSKGWHGRYIIKYDQKYKDLLAHYKLKHKIKENNNER